MSKTDDNLPNNALSAEDLLRNKSTRYFVWDEWEKSAKVLPKRGQKQFEPNGSSLQNMQIEKGIKNLADLLSIERVERRSQLAIAEWIPSQKRARVIKKSGQDWHNFGTEINCSLFLIPEEALILLEMNCLELMWDGVPMSVQQAYEVLIDGSECSLEEYRVYSQLVRYGYRIQRFVYEKSNESSGPKRKIIVDPENGLRMADKQMQNCTKKRTRDVEENTESTKDNYKNNKEVEATSSLLEDVRSVIEDIICKIDSVEDTNQENLTHRNGTNEIIETDSTKESLMETPNKKCRRPKVEIISDETLIDGINIIKKSPNNSVEKTGIQSKWPGSRIQRNVKLLPKRTDKSSGSNVNNCNSSNNNSNQVMSDISIIDIKDTSREKQSDKRKASTSTEKDGPNCKKSKHEVIELSDDEIQEVPQPLTRTQILNLIPNMASKSAITETISRAYIPHNIKPTKHCYYYERPKTQDNINIRENDRRSHPNSYRQSFESRSNVSNYSAISNNRFPQRSVVPYHRHNVHPIMLNTPRSFGPMWVNFSFHMYARFPFNPGFYWHESTFCLQNMFQHRTVFGNHGNYTRSINPLHQSAISPLRQLAAKNPKRQSATEPNRSSRISPVTSNDNEIYKSTFTKYAGVNSWGELKKKWQDERTITLDNEDGAKEDGNEIEILRQRTNPLVGPKNVTSFADVYNRLRIIKSANEKTVRGKKCRYKISYNIYSSSHHYRKANPGEPLYRVVVIRKDDSPFLQPVELAKLQQDAKGSQLVLAHVAMTISYIKSGVVTLPNLNE